MLGRAICLVRLLVTRVAPVWSPGRERAGGRHAVTAGPGD
jgi:hypothetical protein